MRLLTTTLLTGLLTTLALGQEATTDIDAFASRTLNITHLFTVNVTIGKPLAPIPIRGGDLIIIPITGGKVSGPALNGTVSAGIVRASYFANNTIEYPNNSAYGETCDGESFIIEQVGQGLAGSQAAGLKIQIGGEYGYLTDTFILTRNVDHLERSEVTIEGFSVS